MRADITVPIHNENEMAQMAERLGWDGIVFLYADKKDSQRIASIRSKIPIYYASPNDPKAALIIKESTGDDRAAIERGGFSILHNLEAKQKHDSMHQRQSGLNHVLCELMRRKKIAYGCPLRTLLNTDASKRGVLIGRMQQNFSLCEKYGVTQVIASFATTPYQMRSPHDLQRTFNALGMSTAQAKAGIMNLGSMMR